MLTLRRTYRLFSTNSSRSHTYQMHTEPNQTNRTEAFLKYYSKDQLIPGQCTPEATLQYSQKHSHVDISNWKSPYDSNLKLSSIGIGSYSTFVEQKDDIKLFNAIIDSALLGVNVFDTCSQFRYSKGERVINAALKYLIKQKEFKRDEFFIGTKLGYLSDDMDLNIKGDEIIKELIGEKLLSDQDIVQNTHCVHPNYLEYMFERSRLGLGLDVIDVVYLNNFPETQLEQIGKTKFIERLEKAFEFFEEKVNNKRLQYYGLASYSSFRVKDTPYSLQLQQIEKVAERVGGRNHKFRFLQVPINIVASEAFGMGTQTWATADKKQETTVVGVANRLKISVVSCSPLMRGTLINVPVPGSAMKCSNNGAKHLQFIRSIPIPSLLTTLVGQNLNRHVKTNLEVLTVPRLTEEEWMDFVKPSVRKDVDSQ